jgi:hypothetical protein
VNAGGLCEFRNGSKSLLLAIASSNLLTKGVATNFQRAKDLLKKEGRCNERSGRAKGKEWQGRVL